MTAAAKGASASALSALPSSATGPARAATAAKTGMRREIDNPRVFRGHRFKYQLASVTAFASRLT